MSFWNFWQSCVKQASRAQILDKATEYIQFMRRKNHTHQQDIDDLKKQNALLEQQGKWRDIFVLNEFFRIGVMWYVSCTVWLEWHLPL